MRRWIENEDWVEFYTAADLTRIAEGQYETRVRFPGPMSPTTYFFFLRTAAGAEDAVTAVEVGFTEFVPQRRPVVVPRTPTGISWTCLGSVVSERAYRRVVLTAPRGLDGFDRLCVLQVPRRLLCGLIERRISREQAGNPEPLSGVPLGGVGAGKLEMCADGIFRNITVNGNIDAPIHVSECSFFVVRAECEAGSETRVVSTEGLAGLVPFDHLDFDGAYPTATVRAADDSFPLQIELRASGPILPRNLKDSALPLAMFVVKLRSEIRLRATVALSMENFLGCGGGLSPDLTERNTLSEGYYERWEERKGNTERPWCCGGFSGVLYNGGDKQEKRSQGQYVLATDAAISSRLTGWRPDHPTEAWQCFGDAGLFPDCDSSPSMGERTAAAVGADVDLGPGEEREVRFVLAWHVPYFRQSPVMDYGHYYSNFFGSAGEVAEYGLTNFDRLLAGAAEVPELLQRSSLPRWLARSLANDAYVFSTATWLTRDGRFAVNEGPTNMFGCMGTLDQKLYANHYYSLFFPELDRTELLGFARAQAENGGVQHDLGTGHLETRGGHCAWPDLTCAMVILSLKHYQLSGDSEYVDEVYPRLVRMILEYHRDLDLDGDGLADSPEVGNTFDSEHFEGLSCYTATLTLAALRAMEDLAQRRGDTDTARECARRFESGRNSAVVLLWNGRYFGSYFNTNTGRSNPNCHLSQAAGEYFAWLCGLGGLYDDDHAREAINSTLRLNYGPHLAFPTDEATPDGRMPPHSMWGWLPHARLCLGALPICRGMSEEGLDALERMDGVIERINRSNRWDLRLFYEPDTGREHWGRFYMSAPATWYAYQALVGYTWDQPAGSLRLAPNVPDRLLPLSAPVFLPGFWGWLEFAADRKHLRLQIVNRFATGISVRRLGLPDDAQHPVLTADGSALALSRSGAWWECSIPLDDVGDLNIAW